MFTCSARATRLARVSLLGLQLATSPAVSTNAQPGSFPNGSFPNTVGLSLNLDAVKDGELAAAVHRAGHGARRRLERDDCVKVLHEFSDSSGRPLSDVLSSMALTPDGALSRIIFRDGREAAACRNAPIAAFTGAGSRVVFVLGSGS